MDNSTVNHADFVCYQQILGALGYSTFYLWNIIACSLVIVAAINVYRNYTTANFSFYILLNNLLLSDFSYFILYFVAFLPQNFMCETSYGDQVFEILGNLGIASFVALNTNTWLISMNRFLAICFTNYGKKVFTRRNTFVLCAGAWSIGLLSVTVNNQVGCTSRFSSATMSLTFGCKHWNPVFSPHSIYCYICTYSTFVFYFRCLMILKKKSGQVIDQNLAQSMQNKNSRVFQQALLIWLSLVTSMTSFRVIPFITDHIVYTIVNVFFVFCCPNFVPLIPVIFSREIRSALMSLSYISLFIGHLILECTNVAYWFMRLRVLQPNKKRFEINSDLINQAANSTCKWYKPFDTGLVCNMKGKRYRSVNSAENLYHVKENFTEDACLFN